MTAPNLRPQADYFYWTLTLRLVETSEVETWATTILAQADVAQSSLVELSTSRAWDTESILDQLRLVPGEPDRNATFRMILGLISRRYFAGIDDLDYTMRLSEAIHHQFTTPDEPYSDLSSMCYRWEGVTHGFGEAEKLFRKAFEDFLRQFLDE